MRPTSVELLERIAEALDQTVLPAVGEDKWAASVVRSATTLLGHLAKRVPLEAPVLLADNDDARAVLTDIAARFASSGSNAVREIETVIVDDTPIDAYDVVALDTRNATYQRVMERLLREYYRDSQAPGAAADMRRNLRHYFKRRMERERDMYFPSFTGPPF
jgi:hypothetical protein